MTITSSDIWPSLYVVPPPGMPVSCRAEDVAHFFDFQEITPIDRVIGGVYYSMVAAYNERLGAVGAPSRYEITSGFSNRLLLSKHRALKRYLIDYQPTWTLPVMSSRLWPGAMPSVGDFAKGALDLDEVVEYFPQFGGAANDPLLSRSDHQWCEEVLRASVAAAKVKRYPWMSEPSYRGKTHHNRSAWSQLAWDNLHALRSYIADNMGHGWRFAPSDTDLELRKKEIAALVWLLAYADSCVERYFELPVVGTYRHVVSRRSASASVEMPREADTIPGVRLEIGENEVEVEDTPLAADYICAANTASTESSSARYDLTGAMVLDNDAMRLAFQMSATNELNFSEFEWSNSNRLYMARCEELGFRMRAAMLGPTYKIDYHLECTRVVNYAWTTGLDAIGSPFYGHTENVDTIGFASLMAVDNHAMGFSKDAHFMVANDRFSAIPAARRGALDDEYKTRIFMSRSAQRSREVYELNLRSAAQPLLTRSRTAWSEMSGVGTIGDSGAIPVDFSAMQNFVDYLESPKAQTISDELIAASADVESVKVELIDPSAWTAKITVVHNDGSRSESVADLGETEGTALTQVKSYRSFQPPTNVYPTIPASTVIIGATIVNRRNFAFPNLRRTD